MQTKKHGNHKLPLCAVHDSRAVIRMASRSKTDQRQSFVRRIKNLLGYSYIFCLHGLIILQMTRFYKGTYTYHHSLNL